METSGFLETVTKIHCAVIICIDTGEALGFRPDELDRFFEIFSNADEAYGHNSIKFDEEVIRKLYPRVTFPKFCGDTMVLGRLIHPDIKSSDFVRAKAWREYSEWETKQAEAEAEGLPTRQWPHAVPKPFPAKLIGSHSLAAWGYRLGEHKGDFVTEDDWATFTEPMFDYMMQDGAVTYLLFTKLMAHDPSPQSLELEHRIARLCAQIERNGFPFDEKAAIALHGKLVDEREELRVSLLTLFPNWKVRQPDFIPKRSNKTQGYIAGEPVERWKDFEFNPASRDHIAYCLTAKYGWKPSVFTDNGKPVVDDDVLVTLPYPEAQKLARFFLLEKRIGQLAEGNQAWLKVVKNGKIHARYTPNGTVTGRSTHSHPNISQVPRVSSEFGRDCRALFHAPAGWIQLGADQQGLELRCLASDLAGLAGDGGHYAQVVTEGDVHTTNMEAAGLTSRDQAKTLIYAFLYGGGDERIGSIIGKGKDAGRKIKGNLLSKTPGLAALIKIVKGAAKRGWIKGIDGRKVPIRSDHSALNMRLQNAGAVLCKQWGCDWDDGLQGLGLKHGWEGDYVFLGWLHDEFALAIRDDNPELLETVKRIGIETGRAAGLPYNFQCPLDVGVMIGRNWSECH